MQRPLKITLAVGVLLLAAVGRSQQIPPWMLGDEAVMQCYWLNNTVMASPPTGVSMTWLSPLPAEMDTATTSEVRFVVDVSDAFWADPYNTGTLMTPTQLSKYSSICRAPMADNCTTATSSNCCVFHSNLHSCRAETGVCQPWVKAVNSSSGGAGDAVLVTHTASKVGTAGTEYTHNLKLPDGDWIVIAHVKIMSFQCAVGARRTVTVPPASMTGTMIIVVGVLVGIVVCLFTVMAVQKYMAWRRVALAPKDGAGPIAAGIFTIKRFTKLTRLNPTAAAASLQRFQEVLRSNTGDCYAAQKIGAASFLVVATVPEALLDCATAVQEACDAEDWTGNFGVNKRETTDRRHSMASNVTINSTADRADRRQSMAASRRQSMASNVTRNSSNHNPTGATGFRFQVAFGAAYDAYTVTHDKDKNTYEYAGPVLSRAAKVCDMAPGRISLVCESITEALMETQSPAVEMLELYHDSAADGVAVAEKSGVLDASTKSALLAPASPTGSAPGASAGFRGTDRMTKMFVVNHRGESIDAANTTAEQKQREGGDDGDSVLAATDAAAGQLALKRVTVLKMRFHGDDWPQMSDAAKADVTTSSKRLLSELTDAAMSERGHITSVEGGDVLITFNAFTPVDDQVNRAVNVAKMLVRAADMGEWECSRVTCGMATAFAYVGNLCPNDADAGTPPRHVIVGQVRHTAEALEQMARHLAPGECDILAVSTPEVQRLTVCQAVGTHQAVPKPAFGSDGLVVPAASGVANIVVSLGDIHEEQEGDDIEWMYALQERESGNPYREVNSYFGRIAASQVEDEAAKSDAILYVRRIRESEEEPDKIIAASTGFAKLTALLGEEPATRDTAGNSA
jgi:hypothetical protein